ncbi:hypothetical protein BDCR2A_01604 [Borrelia duttonii CR2A]|uniref:Uncharacterized protein n=1 Tax=Borrelia duttonii CR2A TaxID=1432657 RepID=W6TJV6_9SPIR|nr:hypothetical protein BDCR2A_01604 [Borrelia duttonii CR2A]
MVRVGNEFSNVFTSFGEKWLGVSNVRINGDDDGM